MTSLILSKYLESQDPKMVFLKKISNFTISQDALYASQSLAEMILNVLSQTDLEDLVKLKKTFYDFIVLFDHDMIEIINTIQINNIYQPTFLASYTIITDIINTPLSDLYTQFNAMLNGLIMVGCVLSEKAIIKMSKTWMIKQSSDLISALSSGVILGTNCLKAYKVDRDNISSIAGSDNFQRSKNILITSLTIAIEGTSVSLLTPST